MKACCLYLLNILFFSLSFSSYSLAQFYQKDPSFEPFEAKRNGGYISAITKLPDNKILVNGNMDYVNSIERDLPIRLNEDGSLDESFQLAAYGEGWPIAVRKDGKLVMYKIGNDSNGEMIVSLSIFHPDGELDSSFNTEIKTSAMGGGIDIQEDNKIIVSSIVLDENSTYKGIIKRVNPDGSLDNTFDTGDLKIIWIVKVAIQPDGKILATGSFEFKDGTEKRIIRLNTDGSLDTGFSPPFNEIGTVNAISFLADGKILLGMRSQLIRLHPSGKKDDSFSPNFYSVRSIGLQPDGKILIGCYVRDTQNYIHGHGPVLRLNPDGSEDETFDAGVGATDAAIHQIEVLSDGKILVGGHFSEYNGREVHGILRLNGSNGTVDPTFSLNLKSWGYIENGVLQEDGKLLVFGDFVSANDQPYSDLTRLNTDGTIDNSFNIGSGVDGAWDLNGDFIRSVAVQADHKIIAGGYFTSFNKIPANSLIRLNADGSTDMDFKKFELENYYVNAVSIQNDGKILVGGSGSSRLLTRLLPDGSIDPEFIVDQGTNGNVNSIQIQEDGKIIISGSFTSYHEKPANSVIRLNSDGSIDETFKVDGSNFSVKKMALQKDGKVLLLGDFMFSNNVLVNSLIRLDENGNLDETFMPDFGQSFQLLSFDLKPDGQILVSGFLFGGSKRMILLKNDGSLVEDFNLWENDLNAYAGILQREDKILAFWNNKLLQFYSLKQQEISFDEIPDQTADAIPFTLEASATSGLPVTFQLISGPAIVEGNVVTLNGEPGLVKINATQNGNEIYARAEPVERSFQVIEVLGVFGDQISNSIKVYPNPTSDYLFVDSMLSLKGLNIQLVNLQGQKVRVFFEKEAEFLRVDLRRVPKGVYFLQINDENKRMMQKVVVK